MDNSTGEGQFPPAGNNGKEHEGTGNIIPLPDNGTVRLAPVLPPAQRTSATHADRRGLRVLGVPMPMRRASVGASKQDHDGDAHPGSLRLLIFSALAMTVILSALMTLPILPGQLEIHEGMPAPKDILSPSYLSYNSTVLTEKAREQARNDPANQVWVQDKDVVQRQRSSLLNALSAVDDVRQNETLDTAARRQRLASLPGIKLSATDIDTLLSMSDSDYSYWRDYGVLGAFDSLMNNRRLTSVAEVEAARTTLPDVLVPALTVDQRSVASAFVSPLIAVNMRLDDEQTAARQDAASRVKPIIVTVQKGEAILRQGEIATAEAIEKMQQAGLLSRGVSAQVVVGTAGLVLLLMILLHLYIYRYAAQVWRRQKQLLLVDMLIIFTVIVNVLFLPGHNLLPYFLPVAAVAMLVSVLLDANLGVLMGFAVSLLLGISMGSSLSMELPIYYLVGSLAGIFTLTRVEKVSAFARAGFYIAVASFMAAVMLKVLTGTLLDWSTIANFALAAAFNGGMSTAITYAAFSLLGTLFGITTPLQLMELAHPDQPLLRRLMREAPGTYHHSLVVSNLAEHAAEMIGADPLLTRVCAYYHDIGKVAQPYYFIDNQAGRANIHDQLSPWESAKIIARHVDDGLALGRQNDLPRKVLDAIPQHHGTMLIKFFYHKALHEDPDANQDDFRYHGPKPQTKENAILMLADGVEATVRAMAQSGALDKAVLSNSDASESPSLYNDTASLPDDAVATVVHKIISERIEDGQLDECDLTVRDIARIQEAFVSMLKGIYHPRVPYPEKPKAAEPVTELNREPAVPAPVIGQAELELPAGSRRGIRKLRLSSSVETKHEPQTPAAGTG